MCLFVISVAVRYHKRKVQWDIWKLYMSESYTITFSAPTYLHQWSISKESLAECKRAIHKGIKYACRQCDNQAT